MQYRLQPYTSGDHEPGQLRPAIPHDRGTNFEFEREIEFAEMAPGSGVNTSQQCFPSAHRERGLRGDAAEAR